MEKRKSIPKKIRFEVFKRDRFTCQYCGRMAPDVILEVDHIEPVAEGGDDNILNLITSCRDCNRGKGKTRISDDAAIKLQQEALKELAEKREQTEMMYLWKKEIANYENEQAEMISLYLRDLTGDTLNDYGIASAKKYIKTFSFHEVMEAIDIAFNYYYEGDDDTWNKAWNKVGGICFNRRKQRENG